MAAKRARFNIFAHTADLGIELRAPALSALFACAARALSTLLVAGKVRCGPIACARIEAADRETLLVDWLNELLYQSEDKDIAFRDFHITSLDTSMTSHAPAMARLHATVVGGPVRELRRTIKAATFNALAIRRLDNGYEAEIVFDV